MIPIFGAQRKIAIVRELSKLYESTFRGTLEEAFDFFSQKSPKGEFVIIVEGIKI
jgi:16S rRNA (cytidine1402-2'-O)-methyltransferase